MSTAREVSGNVLRLRRHIIDLESQISEEVRKFTDRDPGAMDQEDLAFSFALKHHLKYPRQIFPGVEAGQAVLDAINSPIFGKDREIFASSVFPPNRFGVGNLMYGVLFRPQGNPQLVRYGDSFGLQFPVCVCRVYAGKELEKKVMRPIIEIDTDPGAFMDHGVQRYVAMDGPYTATVLLDKILFGIGSHYKHDPFICENAHDRFISAGSVGSWEGHHIVDRLRVTFPED